MDEPNENELPLDNHPGAIFQTSTGSYSLGQYEIVKLLGMVNATPDFADQPKVINGCSDLLVSIFGEENGKHARSAVGMGSLPGQITVEIEMIVELN